MEGEDVIIVSYDISDDKLRTKFSKYLEKYGHRIQYSVFEIDNSERLLDNIVNEIKNRFEKRFDQRDSVMILVLSKWCKTVKMGYAANVDKSIVLI